MAGDGILEVVEISKRFGGLTAVDHLSFEVEEGTIFGIIGPNGSGKTTSLNCINGLYRPDGGRIIFRGLEIQGMPAHEVANVGIGRTFQVPKIFKRMTVIENLLVPVLSSASSDEELKDKARELLSSVQMMELEASLGEELSGGQQKLLELLRILMLDPEVLLLDEPFAGVHPTFKAHFYRKITELQEKGKTVILVSHDLTSIYALCQRIMVLDQGRMIAMGSPSEIKRNERVIEAYLGR
jgi:branched-chain amino acid transport system ATP-binding protein